LPSLGVVSWPPERKVDSTTNPPVLLLLANLGRPRRPAGASVARAEPALPDAVAASAQLAEVVDRPIAEADLADLRRLQRAAAQAAEAILAGEDLDCTEINTLARDSTARIELVVADCLPRRQFVWTDASPAAALARRLVEELGVLEPDRLRRCDRSECSLLFYDSTKSRTRRWHAEDPCGRRERQRAHRMRQPNRNRVDRETSTSPNPAGRSHKEQSVAPKDV
jgi:predicted RNA-binding Zn ribbon-like protein